MCSCAEELCCAQKELKARPPFAYSRTTGSNGVSKISVLLNISAKVSEGKASLSLVTLCCSGFYYCCCCFYCSSSSIINY